MCLDVRGRDCWDWGGTKYLRENKFPPQSGVGNCNRRETLHWRKREVPGGQLLSSLEARGAVAHRRCIGEIIVALFLMVLGPFIVVALPQIATVSVVARRPLGAMIGVGVHSRGVNKVNSKDIFQVVWCAMCVCLSGVQNLMVFL